MEFKNGRLMIFAKAPVAGEVKTRMIPALTPVQAAELQHHFILDTLQKSTQNNLATVELWCSPDTNHSVFKHCANQFPVSLHTQIGDDLGERMENAFSSGLTSSDWTIIIGTDCPSLSIDDLDKAMHKLEHGYQAVIQPARDGGYVLIGLTQNSSTLFTNIDWGTSQVFTQTRERLDKLGWRYVVLEERQDIDRPVDLKYL
ncbi:MAG: TIGR04282 family arsenosugar biosynthesis glycosyltransferase [Gammaproteobacteria bacterium]|nr:TIGR04282 family arsenosugar biosynthesis glycosyltransferase [Gammaproteobacteria bacterium]